MAGRLAIIQLCKQRKEDLHASDGVYAALDGVSHHSLHILPKQTQSWFNSTLPVVTTVIISCYNRYNHVILYVLEFNMYKLEFRLKTNFSFISVA